jgi:hypothetical protein
LPASLNHVLDDVHTCYIFSPFYIITQRFNAIFGLLDKDENDTLSSKSAIADVLYPPPLLYLSPTSPFVTLFAATQEEEA